MRSGTGCDFFGCRVNVHLMAFKLHLKNTSMRGLFMNKTGRSLLLLFGLYTLLTVGCSSASDSVSDGSEESVDSTEQLADESDGTVGDVCAEQPTR